MAREHNPLLESEIAVVLHALHSFFGRVDTPELRALVQNAGVPPRFPLELVNQRLNSEARERLLRVLADLASADNHVSEAERSALETAAAEMSLSRSIVMNVFGKTGEIEAASSAKPCGFCNEDIPASFKFCGHCGHPAQAVKKLLCSACQFELAPGAKFCGSCGQKVGNQLKLEI